MSCLLSPRCGEKWWERKVLSFFLRSWQHEVEARNVKFEFLYTCHVFPSSSPLFFIIIILQCIFFISSIVFFWFTIFKSKVWTLVWSVDIVSLLPNDLNGLFSRLCQIFANYGPVCVDRYLGFDEEYIVLSAQILRLGKFGLLSSREAWPSIIYACLV